MHYYSHNISKTLQEQTFVSVTGNFLTIALIAGSKALSDKNPGLAFASEHAWLKTINILIPVALIWACAGVMARVSIHKSSTQDPVPQQHCFLRHETSHHAD